MPTMTKLSVTARHGFVAPLGFALGAVDFSSQELYIGAVLSQDPVMLRSFEVPVELPLLDSQNNQVVRDGKPVFYTNPDSDLHTITAQACCFPQIFAGKPVYEWVKVAKDESLIRQKGKARDYAKRTNFGIIYGQTDVAMSEMNHVPKETAAQWIKGHEAKYHVFHKWAQEVAHISTARGWIDTLAGRIRWVGEDNAKAAGASPGRSGRNHVIQGLAAEMTKLALIKIKRLFAGTDCKLCIQVHDEIVVVVPGRIWLDPNSKIKDGILIPKYQYDESVAYWADQVKQAMEAAEAEVFASIGVYPGKAEASVSVYWAH